MTLPWSILEATEFEYLCVFYCHREKYVFKKKHTEEKKKKKNFASISFIIGFSTS